VTSRLQAPKSGEVVTVHWGTNVVARFARTNLSPILPPHATNIHAFAVQPKTVNGEMVLTLQPEESPAKQNPDNFVLLKNYGPISAFMVAIKLALYGGLVLALPWSCTSSGNSCCPP